MTKSSANFNVNGEGLEAVAGYINGMTKEVQTDQYIGSVINFVHARLAPEFDRHMDRKAQANHSAFHHVYEWPSSFGSNDTIGQPQYRLWRQNIKGNGRQKTAGFYFIASKRAVPVNPVLAEPGPTGNHVRIGFHRFAWKAAVMEFGMQVSISPQLGEWLALVPSGSSKIAFTRKTITQQGGNDQTRGAFTREFVTWWAKDAGNYFDEYLAPRLSEDLIKEGSLSRISSKNTSKSLTISAGSEKAAYNKAMREATARMKKNESNYLSASLERMNNIGGI